MAWVSLDADDNGPVRFWHHVAFALDRAVPGIGQDALALLTSGSLALLAGLPDHPRVLIWKAVALRAAGDEAGALAAAARGVPWAEAEGYRQLIADRLFLALPTVKRHVGGLLGKVGAASRTHLVALAREKGLL